VLLDENLTPKISDFGLSRFVDDQGASGKTQSDVGPIRWYSQECFSLLFSEKSDVWAWGCTIVEIVTGQVPFPNLDLVSVLSCVRESRQSALDYLPPGTVFPSWLLPPLQQSFQYDPAMRPTFRDIVQSLEKNAPQSVRIVEDRLEEQRTKREAVRAALNDAGL
jgi:serine/threonine protein kinase